MLLSCIDLGPLLKVKSVIQEEDLTYPCLPRVHEEIFTECDKKCVGLESLTPPVPVVAVSVCMSCDSTESCGNSELL